MVQEKKEDIIKKQGDKVKTLSETEIDSQARRFVNRRLTEMHDMYKRIESATNVQKAAMLLALDQIAGGKSLTQKETIVTTKTVSQVTRKEMLQSEIVGLTDKEYQEASKIVTELMPKKDKSKERDNSKKYDS